MYERIDFPHLKDRPFFYTNFVSTVDGKVQVVRGNWQEYWPIGSRVDHQVLVELRANANLLIHGKKTFLSDPAVFHELLSPEFHKLRKSFGKEERLPYLIVANKLDDQFLSQLQDLSGNPVLIAGSEETVIPDGLEKVEVIRAGKGRLDVTKLAEMLYQRGYRNILVEGGPTLVGSFLKSGLLDEIFLTISPKIFGNSKDSTLTLIEGVLFQADRVPQLKLISQNVVESEVFLRYKVVATDTLLPEG